MGTGWPSIKVGDGEQLSLYYANKLYRPKFRLVCRNSVLRIKPAFRSLNQEPTLSGAGTFETYQPAWRGAGDGPNSEHSC